MTAAIKEWLLGVVAAALVVSMARAITPEGTVKKIGRLVGGLLLLLAAVRPLLGEGPEGSRLWPAPELSAGEVQAQAAENQALYEALLAQEAERISSYGCGEE